MAEEEVSAGHCVAFAIFASLAVLSHYSAAFFLGACVAVLVPRLRGMEKKSIALAGIALAFPMRGLRG